MANKLKNPPVVVDVEVMGRVAKLNADATKHSQGARAENECRNSAVMGIYSQIVAETIRLPGKADHYPTAQTGKALVEALQEHANMKKGAADRYWKTTRGAVHRIRKEKLLPSQATAEAVAAFFKENGIASQNQLGVFGGTIERQSDLVEQLVDKLCGKRNAASGMRNAQRSLSDIRKDAERLKMRIAHTLMEIEVQDEARQRAEAENRKIEDILAEMVPA